VQQHADYWSAKCSCHKGLGMGNITSVLRWRRLQLYLLQMHTVGLIYMHVVI
jgi:hypothetical protein